MASFGGGSFSHRAPILSTDLRCYFECPQGFKKDYDLRLHLKIKHKGESEEELRRAYQDAEEEIALVKRSLSLFQCAMCPKKYDEAGPFYGHIKKVHNMQWLEYKEQFGRCESEVGSFECKICGRVVKYDRECVHSHLKKVHNINWTGYVDRIRKMRRGERPKELPNIETFECKICNSTVKFTFRLKHLKGVHKITEPEYIELFGGDMATSKEDGQFGNQVANNEEGYEGENPGQNYAPGNEVIERAPQPYFDHNNNPNHVDQGYSNKFQEQEPYNSNRNHQEQYQHSEPMHPQQEQVRYENAPPPNPGYHVEEALPPQVLPKPSKADIQDKTNTICSSCSIEFEFRKAFIEHCTNVHNMKFRTKSGAMISSATMQQPIAGPAF